MLCNPCDIVAGFCKYRTAVNGCQSATNVVRFVLNLNIWGFKRSVFCALWVPRSVKCGDNLAKNGRGLFGVSDLVPKWVRLVKNEKTRDFSYQVSVHFDTLNVLKYDLNSPN